MRFDGLLGVQGFFSQLSIRTLQNFLILFEWFKVSKLVLNVRIK